MKAVVDINHECRSNCGSNSLMQVSMQLMKGKANVNAIAIHECKCVGKCMCKTCKHMKIQSMNANADAKYVCKSKYNSWMQKQTKFANYDCGCKCK